MNEMDKKLLFRIALTLIPGIGCKSYRQLMEVCDDPEELFSMNRESLNRIFGNHTDISNAIANKTTMRRAEEECLFLENNNISPLFYTDTSYPRRLNRADCTDTPPLLYCHGSCNLNAKHVVSIVGTRRMTHYGHDMAEKIVHEIQSEDLLIVSGLAYGVDTAAHTAALANGIPTAGVLGHGLDQLYPPQNRKLAHSMIEHGGCLLTEYPSYTQINPAYFPARNRIIAALADAVIVVEASDKGGALITANIANSYHRDVFAVPGRNTDTYSRGCNNLIANNKALIYNNADTFFFNMGWKRPQSAENSQQQLFATLSHDEQAIVDLLKKEDMLGIDEICADTGYSLPKVAGLLLNLEMSNIIRCLPGKTYKLIPTGA